MKYKIQNLILTLALFAGRHAALAQGTTFTYQGRVTDSGTNFTGAGQFKFALVISSNANQTATAAVGAGQPSGGYITGYQVIGGGSGYVTAPAVTVFGGGGAGATAVAHLTGGSVTSLTVGNTGNGSYTSAPTVLVAPPPANWSYTTYWSNDGTSSAGSEPAAAVGVSVTNGLFTVVLGDTTQPNMTALNAALFTQPNLQLRIWFNDGVNGSAVLSPLQNLTPTPYAIMAANFSGAVSAGQIAGGTIGTAVTLNNAANQLTGSFTGNGANVTNVNASTLNGLTSSSFWKLGGNNVAAGQFLGSTNNQPAEIWVNNQRALRIEPNTNGVVNIIGGTALNTVAAGVVGATIGGGGSSNYSGNYFINTIFSSFGTIAGGAGNSIQTNADNSAVGGGVNNQIQASALSSIIGGGSGNWIYAGSMYATIAGGVGNRIEGAMESTISGGGDNIINANAAISFIGGGRAEYHQLRVHHHRRGQ